MASGDTEREDGGHDGDNGHGGQLLSYSGLSNSKPAAPAGARQLREPVRATYPDVDPGRVVHQRLAVRLGQAGRRH
jgi:hypothetical protein